MIVRIGKVTNIYPKEGKVKVLFEDENSASAPLSLMCINKEYSIPNVGERVITLHLENGGSKGFVLGSYFGGVLQPRTNGHRKDFGNGVEETVEEGRYMLKADDIIFLCSSGKVRLNELIERIERIENSMDLPHTV